MPEVVERYLTEDGGLIEIFEHEIAWFKDGRGYEVRWSPSFSSSLSLDKIGFCEEIEEARKAAEDYFSNLITFENFGEYILYSRRDSGGGLEISLREENFCHTPMMAKDVPVDSYLYRKAGAFFRWWKGPGAVEGHHLAAAGPSQKPPKKGELPDETC